MSFVDGILQVVLPHVQVPALLLLQELCLHALPLLVRVLLRLQRLGKSSSHNDIRFMYVAQAMYLTLVSKFDEENYERSYGWQRLERALAIAEFSSTCHLRIKLGAVYGLYHSLLPILFSP